MKSKKNKFKIAITAGLGAIALLYCVTIFTEIPLLSQMRNLWIETAMTTGEHQWLATTFFPEAIINKVMKNQISTVDGIAGLPPSEDLSASPQIDSSPNPIKTSDILNQSKLNVGDLDHTGREILVNDIQQGIIISEVIDNAFVGRVVLIDDPSRVFIATTDKKDEKGKLICDFLIDENAVVGINASGFSDYNGVGNGGTIIGQTIAQGEVWGDYIPSQLTIGFDDQNRLIAGTIDNWEEYHIRDAIQFSPVLIKDGEVLTKGSAGWGLQPRTIIAQRKDGVVLFLVIDGRKPGYSLGATMGECADVLLSYDAITAAACDGGSSSVLAYNEKILNVPSTPMTTGRFLPNAFLVKRK